MLRHSAGTSNGSVEERSPSPNPMTTGRSPPSKNVFQEWDVNFSALVKSHDGVIHRRQTRSDEEIMQYAATPKPEGALVRRRFSLSNVQAIYPLIPGPSVPKASPRIRKSNVVLMGNDRDQLWAFQREIRAAEPVGVDAVIAVGRRWLDLVGSSGSEDGTPQVRCGSSGSSDSTASGSSGKPSSGSDGVRYRIMLEVGDITKRKKNMEQARRWYWSAIDLRKDWAQGWINLAKLEEELSEYANCAEVLRLGLLSCPLHETLMIKSVKLYEQLGDLSKARSLFQQLRKAPVEISWRPLLEGAALETRAGNYDVAREIFSFLVTHVQWYGPLYLEYVTFEENQGQMHTAMVILERGLGDTPRYGPLWFLALRLYECVEGMDAVREVRSRALNCVTAEVVWKVHYAVAMAELRAGNDREMRRSFALAAHTCSNALRWKVWVACARANVRVGNTQMALSFLDKAEGVSSKKVLFNVILEKSRLFEYLGQLDQARALLEEYSASSWCVSLERVYLEMRAGNFDDARAFAMANLDTHCGRGRLWAVYLDVMCRAGFHSGLLAQALQDLPKSGEIWCEGARCAMKTGDYEEARRCLQFAITFTPQYGDSFVEYIRLLILTGADEAEMLDLRHKVNISMPNYGPHWLWCRGDSVGNPGAVFDRIADILHDGEDIDVFANIDPNPGLSRFFSVFGVDALKF